jgi:signal transduction histidine kinase
MSRPPVSLQTRLIAASVVLAVLVIGVFVALIFAASAARTATNEQARSKNVTTSALQLEKLILDLEAGLRGYVLTGNSNFLQPYTTAKGQLPEARKDFVARTKEEPAQRARAQLLLAQISQYREEYVAPVLGLAKDHQLGAAKDAAQEEGTFRIDQIQRDFKSLIDFQERLADSRKQSADAKTTHAIELGVAGLIGSTILILLFGLYLSRSIARPVREAADGASLLAAGDLSLRLSERGPGEVGELTRSFNQMAGRLQETRSELEGQNAQLRESERLKSDLVNTVSHELRTPLSGVLGFTKLLLTRDFDSETRRHYLGIIDAQARRLAELIDDFLDMRRIEEGRFERAQELVDMVTLLREEAQLYSLQSSKHQLAVEVGPKPLPVLGNPDRLRQVIGNLISNAIKYSPQGGIVQISAEAENGSVRVEIRDEGMGIPLSKQPQIFTKFFRGDAAASGITGTGLGLAVSRDIVESHGGRIGFTSAEGEGTTFFVELPGANGGPAEQGNSPEQS